MEQRSFGLLIRREAILIQDRRDESTGGTLPLGPSNVYRVQPVEIRGLSSASVWLRLRNGSLVVSVEVRTSYPILRHQSTISGIEFLFAPWPDFLMASTTAKLVCNVFKATTASCGIGQWEYAAKEVLLAYCVSAACHGCRCGRKAPYLGARFAQERRQCKL